MGYDEPKRWTYFLPLVLWAYLMLKHNSTNVMPFSLVYGRGNGSCQGDGPISTVGVGK